MNSENFYIVAQAPQDETLQVRISGPYLTQQAAQADLKSAIDEATCLDPNASSYHLDIQNRKPETRRDSAYGVARLASKGPETKP